MAEFYSARGWEIPPLPWTNLSPPFSGATLALTGTVQKVSNLILNINIMLTEVADPLSPRGASVGIRGNTDESWSRGMSYLIRNRLPR